MFGTVTAIIFIIIISWIASEFVYAPVCDDYDEYDEGDFL